MENLQFDYGYINERGHYFIPKALQEESEIAASTDGFVTLVKCESVEGYIVISHYKTFTKEEYKEIKKDKPGNIQAVDEFGRIVLPKSEREKLNISPYDTLISFLADYTTIKVKPFIIKETAATEIA